MRNPFESTAVVIHRDGGGSTRFGGTAFSMLDEHWFVTADHVVKEKDEESLGLALYIAGQIDDDCGLDIGAIHRHPSADLALLHTPHRGFKIFDPFRGVSEEVELGDPLRSFGFPCEGSPEGQLLIPRMLRGYLQRRFHYESPLGYRYAALEISNPVPGGMSGAPVSLDSDPASVMGVVAESFRSESLLSQVTEIEAGGERFTEMTKSVVTYGLVVDLRPHVDWIRGTIEGSQTTSSQHAEATDSFGGP